MIAPFLTAESYEAYLYQTQMYKGMNIPNLFLHHLAYTKQNMSDFSFLEATAKPMSSMANWDHISTGKLLHNQYLHYPLLDLSLGNMENQPCKIKVPLHRVSLPLSFKFTKFSIAIN